MENRLFDSLRCVLLEFFAILASSRLINLYHREGAKDAKNLRVSIDHLIDCNDASLREKSLARYENFNRLQYREKCP